MASPLEDDALIGDGQTAALVDRDGPVDKWRPRRAAIHDDVCDKGSDPAIGAFIQYYGSKDLDASLLMTPLVGCPPASDPRVLGTVRAIQEPLSFDGFISRHATRPAVDGLPPGEAAFLPCTFWLADNLALQPRHGEARQIFERLLAVGTDLGRLAEEYDPVIRRLVGNVPQAFSHVGLVNTARNLTADGGPAEQRPAG